MKTPLAVTRRQFLKTAGTLAVAPTIITSSTWGAERPAPSGRLNLGFVGVGTKGRGHLGNFLKFAEVQVMAICEVSKVRRDNAVEMVHKAYAQQKESGVYKGCTGHTDFRELINRQDIDAVVIATPDHWHAITAITAAKAKKDVYCEKPLSHTIVEGRAMVNAAQDNKIIFQTGSQQRTEFNGYFRKAVEYIRSGRIGKVQTIRIGVKGPPRPCDLPPETKPEGVEWDMWVGAAPMREFNHVLCPLDVHKHFPEWRAYKEYGGGALADMGAHHFDIAQWALGMDRSGPTEVIPPQDQHAETGLKFVYANGVEMFHGGPVACTFEGIGGKILVERKGIESEPKSILQERLGEKDFHLPVVGNSHAKNWLDCIKSRQPPVVDAEIGARSATVCHLAYIGYALRRKLKWDPSKEQFVGDAAANKLLDKERRAPWKLG